MRRLFLLPLVGVAFIALAHAGTDFKSGPAPGTMVPGSFSPHNLNGAKGKDRPHCLVCEFGLDPVVAVFARHTPEANEQVLLDFLKKLETACEKSPDDFLHGFVVFLDPNAKNSRTAKEEDPPKLVQESLARDKLIARLTPLAAPHKHVVFAVMPDAPAGYQISDKPGVTVLVYSKHRVEQNYAFTEGKMTNEDGERILKGIEEMLRKGKKK